MDIKLITRPIEKRIDKAPLGYHEKNNLDRCYAKIIVQYSVGRSGAAWWAIEGKRLEDGDILFFGLVRPRWYQNKSFEFFKLSEIKDLKFDYGQRGLERHRFDNSEKTINEVLFH